MRWVLVAVGSSEQPRRSNQKLRSRFESQLWSNASDRYQPGRVILGRGPNGSSRCIGARSRLTAGGSVGQLGQNSQPSLVETVRFLTCSLSYLQTVGKISFIVSNMLYKIEPFSNSFGAFNDSLFWVWARIHWHTIY